MSNPTFLDLAPEQQDLLLDLPFDGRYLVSGPPGSGKTLLAAHRATMLDIAGREVVLLTYSNVLRQYTRWLVEPLGFGGTISTCHKWFHRFWRRRYNEAPPTKGDGIEIDWTEILVQLSTSAIGFDGEIESLVVDEGQDLPNEFYALCTQLAVDVTVFADDNQRIGKDQSTLSEIEALLGSEAERHHVIGNYRNSRQIAELANLFYCGTSSQAPPAPLREGAVPTLERYESENAFADAVADYARVNRQLEIGVALPHRQQLVALTDALHRRGIRHVQAYVSDSPYFRDLYFHKPGVKLFTPVSMKGQEFDTLYVPELEQYAGDVTSAVQRMRFYVLATRARRELHLSYRGEREPELVSCIPPLVLKRLHR
ncbi:AAA family ATPase [Nonomuraea sp. NPDC049655]|uniref:AAA family ATPase n=1 Tax=Nonomuraea sp. NPDC049655 TaxID=3364355 RepID=UPI00378E818F